MIRRKNIYTNTYLWATAFGLLLSQALTAKHFFPCSAEELEIAIVQANVNCEDDVIDLQCNQFDLTASDNSTPTNGSNGLPVIGPDSDHTLKIKNGTISRSTLMGTPEFRFFEIQPGAFLILEKITLENGVVVTGTPDQSLSVSGGAILNQGTLELKDSTIIGFIPPNTIQLNAVSGGGLYNDMGATANIKGSTFSGLQATDGGAAYNVGNMPEICTSQFLNNVAVTAEFGVGGAINNAGSIGLIRRSIFDRNQAPGSNASSGGAILNDGTIDTIAYSTFSSNFSALVGGAIDNTFIINTIIASTFSNNQTLPGGFGGGAISNGFNIGVIANSTFSSNSASDGTGGGFRNQGSSATISAFTNNTVTLNSASAGGGIENNGGVMLNVISNIIANNTGDGSPDVDNSGTIAGEVSYNLIGNGGNVCPTPFDPANHNLVGNCAPFVTTIDPLLESLANNGGPTLTHALRPLSPAIDNGFNPAPGRLKFDQRGPGHPRTIGGSTDIGSYESCVDFDLDGDCDDDNCHCDDDNHDGECDNEHQQ